MKKYRNVIILLVIAIVVAVGAKAIVKEFGYIQLDSSIKVNRYLFYIYVALSVIFILLIIYYGIYILINNQNINGENIQDDFLKKLNSLTFIVGLWAKLSVLALAVTVNQNFYLELKEFGTLPTYFLGAALVLLLAITKYNNYLYPDKKVNPFEDRASEKYFNKLDEGQKWIAYRSSYIVREKMDNFYSILFISLVVLSVFIEIPLILPLVVGILPIVQRIIYALETRKFRV